MPRKSCIALLKDDDERDGPLDGVEEDDECDPPPPPPPPPLPKPAGFRWPPADDPPLGPDELPPLDEDDPLPES